MAEGADRIRGFDGLRALALGLVFLQHTTALGRDYELGGYGVWLFFALSGFLIIRILAGERRRIEAGAQSAGAAIGRFFWRRTLRIVPPYYLVLAVFTLLAAAGLVHDFTWPAAGFHYAWLSNVYFGEIAGRWVGRFGHFWSLAIEEQFYLAAAPLLLFSPLKWARPICAAVVLASLAANVSMRLSGASEIEVYASSLVNFGALGFGGWVGLALPERPGSGRASWPALACVALILGLIVWFHGLAPMPRAEAALAAAAPFLGDVLLGGLLLAAVFLNQRSRLVALLEWRPIAGFGRISYGFYLYHNVLPKLMVGRMTGAAQPEWVEALATFSVALVLSLLSWKLIERPLLRLKDRPPRIRLRSAAPSGQGYLAG